MNTDNAQAPAGSAPSSSNTQRMRDSIVALGAPYRADPKKRRIALKAITLIADQIRILGMPLTPALIAHMHDHEGKTLFDIQRIRQNRILLQGIWHWITPVLLMAIAGPADGRPRAYVSAPQTEVLLDTENGWTLAQEALKGLENCILPEAARAVAREKRT